MSLLHPVAAQNKQPKPDKIGRAAEFVSSIIDAHQHEEALPGLSFVIGSRPEGIVSKVYLEQVAEAASCKLGELGIDGWIVDMPASEQASKVPNTNGYGNESVKIWDKDHHTLVFTHEVTLTKVSFLHPVTNIEASRTLAA